MRCISLHSSHCTIFPMRTNAQPKSLSPHRCRISAPHLNSCTMINTLALAHQQRRRNSSNTRPNKPQLNVKFSASNSNLHRSNSFAALLALCVQSVTFCHDFLGSRAAHSIAHLLQIDRSLPGFILRHRIASWLACLRAAADERVQHLRDSHDLSIASI